MHSAPLPPLFDDSAIGGHKSGGICEIGWDETGQVQNGCTGNGTWSDDDNSENYEEGAARQLEEAWYQGSDGDDADDELSLSACLDKRG